MQLLKAKQKLTDLKVRVRFKGRIRRSSSTGTGITPTSFRYITFANYGDFRGAIVAGAFTSVINVPTTPGTWVDIDLNTTVTLPFDVAIDQILYGCYTVYSPSAIDFAIDHTLEIEENFVEVIGSETAF